MTDFFNHQFLIAMPELKDQDFHRAVVYICQHDNEGALGVVLNRLTPLKLANIFEKIGIKDASEESRMTPVYFGGPVQTERGFIIHDTGTQTWDSSIAVSENVSLTSSRDILEAIAHNEGPEKYLIALGYSGWAKGQLEKEMLNNAWLNVDYDSSILYKTPVRQRWSTAANSMGVNINYLTSMVGHG
ncbi:MAG: YqgE/AlgH family protein [Methylococcales bacterium]|nr:YqgE/AlgH family protein [Methylococcales bacterium]